jgi:hypothetical protein
VTAHFQKGRPRVFAGRRRTYTQSGRRPGHEYWHR